VRNLLLLSTSTVHGSGFLEYAEEEIRSFLGDRSTVTFVPYARPSGISHEEYTGHVREALGSWGFDVVGLHEREDPIRHIHEAEAVFAGGGNTFVLLRELYRTGVLDVLRDRAVGGLPYMGSSAGSNVAGRTIGTTNDMPIVEPPSFDGLGLVPFNINPHYLDPDPDSTHMGETRETRIGEFHRFNTQPVLGLREGAMLRVVGDGAELLGTRGGRLFRADREPEEVAAGADLSALL
jgi:dipeptidase E